MRSIVDAMAPRWGSWWADTPIRPYIIGGIIVVGAALRLAAVAVVVGMAATPVAMKLAAARIAGLDGWHPGTMVAIAALLAVVSACAATVPAYRTARVGELVALRE